MKLLRNLGRRKVRTGLTILGITIGIWSLVVFGSMANKINTMVAGGSQYYDGKIVVSATGGTMGLGGPMPIANVERIAGLPGIDVAFPSVTMVLSDDPAGAASMGPPPMIVSSRAGGDQGRETFVMQPATGRLITQADADANASVVVLGSDLARKYKVRVGDSMTLRGESFTVIGILEPTLTLPDTDAIVPLPAGQRLYLRTLPAIVAQKLNPSEIATGITAYLTPGADPETVAAEVSAAVPGTTTMTKKDFDTQIGSETAILSDILVGIALISLVVGGLSVVNTTAMSIAERTREIGIKRAIGSSRARIVREVVTESALIGFIGGFVGLVLGAVVVCLANEAGRDSGTILFALTTNTATTAVAFSTILGALAGFVPALNAARLDPVAALRYE